MPFLHSTTTSTTPPTPDQILIFGGSSRTLDLLRLATIRSDSVLLVGRAFEAPVTRYAAHFAIEIKEPAQNGADPGGDLGEASAVLVALGDVEAENRIVRAARRHAVPVYVADRALVSDFTLIEFLEQRPIPPWRLEAMLDFIHTLNPLYSLSGFVVGMLVGFTGVGGGSLMTPLLVLLFGIHPATAVGTDLLYAGLTKSGGTLVHGLHGTVDWRVTRRLAAGSVPATVLTLVALAYAGKQSDTSGHLITTVLGVALILTAISLVFRKWLLSRLAQYVEGFSDRQTRLLTNLLGAILGVLVSLSSVGAGAIGVTVLLLLYPKLPVARLVGSDIAHAVPLTLIAGTGHWFLGSIDWSLLVSLLIGSLPGIAIGSHFAARVPDRVLRPILASTLAVVGTKLAF